MEQTSYCLFETPLGPCGIAWKEPATCPLSPVVTFIQLPEATRGLTEKRIAGRSGARKARLIPAGIAGIIKKIQNHLHGDLQDFQDINLELDGVGPFGRQVYEEARKIPAGRTMTYGALARKINRPTASRAIGQALGKNPIPLIIPCHRVLASGNKSGGFSAHGGVTTKARLLAIEGATLGTPATIKSKRDLLQAVALLIKQDPRLAGCLTRPIEFRLRPDHSPCATLIEAVVHQQLSPKAASTILGRVMDLYPGSKIPDPAELQKTEDERLRKAGLSKAKIKALKDIATKTLDGTVPSSEKIVSLSNEEIIKRLTSIYGVGQWTVEMMLIFNLGRVDVLPIGDYALRKCMSEVLGLKEVPTPKQAEILGDLWRPYRTVAALYLKNLKDLRNLYPTDKSKREGCDGN
ncbi:MAG: methylated-DNA--[protein]-cysteine S-methyltransferase [Deltaproteobacteria bacterium]|nr:methylated-DNA--[protein]-cysteine S-methyltransferase [Deltaproteobacteria bacterium]